MFKDIIGAFKVKELRHKIFLTIIILLLYRLGAYLPVPGIPIQEIQNKISEQMSSATGLTLLNLFSGGALSRVSVFALGIMPYITAQIIMQMLQAVIPSLEALSKEGESGQRKITQYTRYFTLALALLNAVGYLFLFKSSSYNVSFSDQIPSFAMGCIVIFTMLVGAMIIMWFGEIITQKGVGNGMSLIIFCNIMAGIPTSITSALSSPSTPTWVAVLTVLAVAVIVPIIIFVERGQRRIPIQYAKRVVGRRVMGGQATYLPIKVNTAGVIPIIFASALLYFPAQISVFFPDAEWLTTFSNAVSSGWLNWILTVLLIVGYAYFYTSLVFNPEDTADQLRKQGGFIPGVRPGEATVAYIKHVINRITLPGALFVAVVAVVPSIIFNFTNNSLLQAFGGTSILIMVGVALDTLTQVQSQLKTHDYSSLFVK